jgi:hypothetical protein
MDKTKAHMPIPSKIRVGKKRYSIDVVESLIQRGLMGTIRYDEERIQIGKQSNKTGRKFTSDEINESFWHELVHAILYDMDEHKLNRNEAFVTAFAKRLSEAVDSAAF